MKQIWSPHVLHKYLSENYKGGKLAMALPSGIYCAENFSWRELLANQSEKPTLNVLENLQAVANRLQAYRDSIFEGQQVIITSAWRHKDYNDRIGGAPLSRHVLGQAVDFYVKDMPHSKVQHLLKHHTGGLGSYSTFTHIDISRKRRF